MKEKVICWEGACDEGILFCCHDCDRKDECPDVCDQWECRKEVESDDECI